MSDAGAARAGPLCGKRVMITRPPHQAKEFADALRARGAQPVEAPLIDIGPPDDPQAARRAAESAGAYDWLIFTSRNAVDAFFRHVPARNAAENLRGVKIAAIGTKTSAALQTHGIAADIVPDSFSGEDLAAALVERIAPGARALIFRAQEARDVVPAALAAAGISADVVAAYKTSAQMPADFRERLRECDAVTFASASAVGAFVKNAGAQAAAMLGTKIVACIGPVTAQAAREQGLRVDVVATDYTVDGLLNALQDRFASTASASPR